MDKEKLNNIKVNIALLNMNFKIFLTYYTLMDIKQCNWAYDRALKDLKKLNHSFNMFSLTKELSKKMDKKRAKKSKK